MAIRLRSRISTAAGRNDALARWRVLRDYETHTVPVGAMILDTKYCELCGCNFLRRATSQSRYCSNCWPTISALNARKAVKLPSQLIH